MERCREWPWGLDDVPGLELPLPADGGRWEEEGGGVGRVRPFASKRVTMSRPGLTEDDSDTSPGFVDVAVSERADDDERAPLSSEFWVMVEVDEEREVADDVPRWVSLSSLKQQVSKAHIGEG